MMRIRLSHYGSSLGLSVGCACLTLLWAQTPAPAQEAQSDPAGGAAFPSTERGRDFGGPPPFGPGGLMPGGPGGPGGPMGQETQLVDRFDENDDGWLNQEERQTARDFLEEERANRGGWGGRGPRRGGPGGPGFPGFSGRGENSEPPEPGLRLSPQDVEVYRGKNLYDPRTLRTFFIEFKNNDWEQELAAFNNTDVEVPAQLTVDGETYDDVGIHFRGMTSYMMVPEGRKRSLNLSLDFIHDGQDIDSYNTLNLLNAHEDPTFMRIVLALDIAREYFPAPKANFVRVVINGESWGVYVNCQQVNKDFLKEWFDTKKGDRWKVTGSPGGRGGLNYLGEDVDPYRQIFDLKSKEDPEAWEALITLCKTLESTPPEQLEAALEPLLNIDGTLRFLAWDNVLANADGYWVRASDYNLYRDKDGRFHLVPHDVNETFSMGGGPGGRGGSGGPIRPRGFGPGMMVAPPMITAGDQNDDGRLDREEFVALAGRWFEQMDPKGTGQVSGDQFVASFSELLPAPEGPGGFGPPGGDGARRRGGFGPATFLGPALFEMLDADHNAALVRSEVEGAFAQWFGEWDTEKRGSLDEAMLGEGVNGALPVPSFGPGPGRGGLGDPRASREAAAPGGRRRGGPGMMGPRGGGGVELDPLVAVDDPSKPLLSKLLVVPSLRAKYLAYVRDMAETWLDWNRLGIRVQEYRLLIEADVKADTRKLDSYEEFVEGVSEEPGAATNRRASLRSFADQRRAYLLKVTTP